MKTNPASKLPIIGKYFRKAPRTQARVYRGIESVRRKGNLVFYAVRALFRAAVRTQHAEIRVIGLENIPPDGSVMLVGNHPNSFLDFFNLLNVVRHPIATAAKDTLTNMPVVGGILRRMYMVPIARRQDQELTGSSAEDRKEANETAVRDAVEMLVGGRLFNIFAEGRSTDSRKLNKLKLGFMAMAIQAEREFNFDLNLRIVPYGFYYDRINKFRSSVCVIFGRPFKLKDLAKLPEDFLALDEDDRQKIEKKLMVAGKERLQQEIEDIIISIPDRSLVDLIDDSVAVYALTPHKYMGAYGNIREKYRLSKTLADAVMNASKDSEGKERLARLRKQLAAYRKNLRDKKIRDGLVRREHGPAEFGYNLRVLLGGIIYSPFIAFGYVANFLPRMVGRLRRYIVIDVQKKEKVNGDEQAVVFAFGTILAVYPLLAYGIYWLLANFAGEPIIAAASWLLRPESVGAWLTQNWSAVSAVAGVFSIYFMARLWRFALLHGRRFKTALYWMFDSFVELFRSGEIRRLREERFEILDAIDFLIGDYHR